MPSALDIVDHSPHHSEAAPPIPTASNVVLIDNYDSFTWNVYQYLVLEGATVSVYRNDKITLDELVALKPTQLVISPGPGHPTTDSGLSRAAIEHFAGKIPIFGVCMGQQCIFDIFGGTVSSAGEILHGKTSPLVHDSRGVYAGLPQNLPVTRYHSLAGTYGTLPPALEVTSWVTKPDGSRGVIMGVRHKELTVEGVQFHPESILSAEGRAMIRNFLLMRGGTWEENERLKVEGAKAAMAAPAIAAAAAKPAAAGGNILQRIYARRREAVAAQKEIPSLRPADLQAAYDAGAAPPVLSLVDRLRQSPFPVALMAEIKRASPSKGVFALDIHAPVQARAYAQAGASVISVLTEPDWFKGSIDDLRAVRQVLAHLPNRPAILRKEFIFDEYQILEARLAGADTVLLIVKMLDDDVLARLYHYSRSLGMEPLVEVQTADEMKRAVALGAQVIGVNNRNLESFEVDLQTTSRLRALVPKDTLLCALSGINTRADVVANEKDGVNAVLVGEAIMRAADPAQFIRQLCSPGATSSSSESSPQTQPLLVKICGTRSAEAAREAARCGADMVGMILVPGTKRCVSDETALAISDAVHSVVGETKDAEDATVASSSYFGLARQTLARRPPGRPLLVGVFQNQPLADILALQRRYRLDVVQLHGREPVEWARLIPVPVLHKFAPGDPGLVGQRGFHVTPLLDSGSGSGEQLEVSAVVAALERDPDLTCLFAGGLTPMNVTAVLEALGEHGRTRILGVDVSSGVETDGRQSLEKIRAFVQAAKAFRRLLQSVTVAVAADLGPGWSDADVARWLAYHGGRFAPTLTADVTHVLCTRAAYARPKEEQSPMLREALGASGRAKRPLIVLRDWLEDTLRRDHPVAGVFGERYVLELFESVAHPPLYWFTARHYKSTKHTQPRVFRPSGTCQLFATEYAHFCAFFRRKTGVAWDRRLVDRGPEPKDNTADATQPPPYFTYDRPEGVGE